MISELAVKFVKGSEPVYVNSIRIVDGKGVEGDCHADGGDRAVCIVSKKTADALAFITDKPCVSKFSPNIIIDTDVEFSAGELIRVNTVEMTVTSVGRECHQVCNLSDCPLINGIVFASVKNGGTITVGDIEEYG